MLFNSQIFVLFFVSVFVLYWSLRARTPQNILLLIASYVFYGTWSWKFLLLMIASTLFDYACGNLIGATTDRKRRQQILVASIAANLGLLFTFKYCGFFIQESVDFLAQLGFRANLPVLQIVLPVGISFYTFQSLGYVVDVYRGKTPPTRNLLNYSLYVAFFPQLVAGPIERAGHLLPQFERPRSLSLAGFESGLFLMIFGLFKKIVIADNLAPYVDSVFSDPNAYSGAAIGTAIVFFAFQIYCDFSGYTDTARGAARMLGFELMQNFHYPYIATNPVDFWRRWHISLSRWFQDYLYYPLAMRYMRKGGWGSKYKAHIAAMTLIGLWHGANWTFLIFGLYWGVLIALYLFWTERFAQWRPRLRSVPLFPNGDAARRALATAIMFVFVCIGWTLFRASSLSNAWAMLSGLLVPVGFGTVVNPEVATVAVLWALIIGLLAMEWLARRNPQWAAHVITGEWSGAWVRSALVAVILFSYIAADHGVARPFIYFQF